MKCLSCFEGKLKRSGQRKKHQDYRRGEAFSSDIFGPININGLPEGVERCFISFIDIYSRFAYVAPLDVRANTPAFLTKLLDYITKTFGTSPKRLISDNAVEYMSRVVEQLFGDMDITHVPIVLHNQEYNGVAGRYNVIAMNAVRTALNTAKIDWSYWPWALADANGK